MSQYVYNKHNTTWKVLAYAIYALVVFVSEIQLVRCAHSFHFWYVNNSCVNTVRQHFPWSILYVSWQPRSQVPSTRVSGYFRKGRFSEKYASTRSVFESFSPFYTKTLKWLKYDSVPHWACVMLQVLMYDIIVFENSAFVRPQVNDFKPEFSKIFTLKSVFEKMRFRWPFSPDTWAGTVVQTEENEYPFSSKNWYVWPRPQTPWLTWNVNLNLTVTHI